MSQKTAWTVAICNIDTIDDEFFRAVRINKADAYKSASEGDDFMTMIRTWLNYDVAVRNEKMSMGGQLGSMAQQRVWHRDGQGQALSAASSPRILG